MKELKEFTYKLPKFYKIKELEDCCVLIYINTSLEVPTVVYHHSNLLLADFSKLSLVTLRNHILTDNTVFLDLDTIVVKVREANKNDKRIYLEVI